jgi:hypothetical protein
VDVVDFQDRVALVGAVSDLTGATGVLAVAPCCGAGPPDALTKAEKARAERAEAQLETEHAERRQLATRNVGNNGHHKAAALVAVLQNARRWISGESDHRNDISIVRF